MHRRGASARPAADHRAPRGARGTRSTSPRASTGRRSASSIGSGSPYEAVGRHGGGVDARQGAGARAAQLGRSPRWARARRLDLALAHGSVDLAVVCAALRIPSVQMQDYEYAGPAAPARLPRREPGARPRTRSRSSGCAGPARAAGKLFRYPGLKEDYYLADFDADPAVLDELGLDREPVLVVVRPPPETSAYHAPQPALRGASSTASPPTSGASAVVIPPHRGARREAARGAAATPNLIVPERAIDAQSLIAFADLVVSAGGTMNREAVALGTPVYTIFSGRMGGVDEG